MRFFYTALASILWISRFDFSIASAEVGSKVEHYDSDSKGGLDVVDGQDGGFTGNGMGQGSRSLLSAATTAWEFKKLENIVYSMGDSGWILPRTGLSRCKHPMEKNRTLFVEQCRQKCLSCGGDKVCESRTQDAIAGGVGCVGITYDPKDGDCWLCKGCGGGGFCMELTEYGDGWSAYTKNWDNYQLQRSTDADDLKRLQDLIHETYPRSICSGEKASDSYDQPKADASDRKTHDQAVETLFDKLNVPSKNMVVEVSLDASKKGCDFAVGAFFVAQQNGEYSFAQSNASSNHEKESSSLEQPWERTPKYGFLTIAPRIACLAGGRTRWAAPVHTKRGRMFKVFEDAVPGDFLPIGEWTKVPKDGTSRRLSTVMEPIELTQKAPMNTEDPYGLKYQELVETVREIEGELRSMMIEYRKTVDAASDVIQPGKVFAAMDPMGTVETVLDEEFLGKMKVFREYLKMLRRFEDALKVAKEAVMSDK